VIARTLLEEPVYARLDLAPVEIHGHLRKAQPNFFLPFDREGVDPFTEKFPVTLRLEGTVRGTGGLRIADEACGTSVRGLYAAGDVATRELICGGFTGGGSHNAAWAISSGTWAGRGAAQHAAGGRRGHADADAASASGGAGLRPRRRSDRSLTASTVIEAVQSEVHPYDRNYFRQESTLTESIGRLDDLWQNVRDGLGGHGGPADAESAARVLREREAASMVAHARWMYASASVRTETRGMHKRTDHPQLDPGQQHRILVGGTDEVWTAEDSLRPYSALELAA
jgi:succinate dehydrogenase/fumarate reductase flavoprotein subunit